MAQGRITALLAAHREGDAQALHDLVEFVWPELHRLASILMQRERRGHVLRPTALVNEAFLRLFRGEALPYQDSSGFLQASVKHMRRVLVDYARRSLAAKRQHSEGEALSGMEEPSLEEIVDLDRALNQLFELDPQAAAIVELKFYAGLSIEEIAAIVERPPRTVVRTWEWSRAWLHERLAGVVFC